MRHHHTHCSNQLKIHRIFKLILNNRCRSFWKTKLNYTFEYSDIINETIIDFPVENNANQCIINVLCIIKLICWWCFIGQFLWSLFMIDVWPVHLFHGHLTLQIWLHKYLHKQLTKMFQLWITNNKSNCVNNT